MHSDSFSPDAADIGLTHAMGFYQSFFAWQGKNDRQKKKRTMLPQATMAFA
jgi:hypothetical protein